MTQFKAKYSPFNLKHLEVFSFFKLGFLFLALLTSGTANAVTYFTTNTLSTWTGANWSTSKNGSGVRVTITAADEIIIQGHHTLTIDTAFATCKTIKIGDGKNSSASLVFLSLGSLVVIEELVFNETNNKIILLDMSLGGSLSCGSIEIHTGGTQTFIPGTGTVKFSRSNTLPSTVINSFHHLTLSSGTTQLGKSITVSGNLNFTNGKLSIGSYTLTLNQTIAGMGATQTIIGSSNSSLVFNGASGTVFFDQSNPGSSNAIKNLTLQSSSNIILGNTLNMVAGSAAGTVTIEAGATLTTGGNLVLKSNSNGTARIGNSAGTIIGQMTVERYIPSRRAYRFLASPVTTNNGISANWQAQTHITGTGQGFDASISNNASMFTLDPTTQNWTAIQNTHTQNLNRGVGYRMMIRGDRSISLNNNEATPTEVVLSATGNYSNGDVTFNTASSPAISGVQGNYAFIGNPFASSIDWNTVSRTNVSASYYTWRSQGGANQRGAYVNYNALSGLGSDGQVNHIIGSGSAIMVQTTGTAPSITFKESDKVSGAQSQQILGKANNMNTLGIQVFEDDTNFVDGLVIYQNENASDDFDAFDSEKWMNPGFNLFSFTSDNKKASIQGFKNLLGERVIYLGMEKAEKKSYTMEFSGADQLAGEAILMDKYTNLEISLKSAKHYVFTVNSDPKSFAPDRFSIVIKNVSSGLNPKNDITNSIILFPNPTTSQIHLNISGTQKGEYSFLILDEMGREVTEGALDFSSEHTQSIQVDQLNSGVYFVRINNNNSIQTIRFVKM